jgi:2',3'-cyclic-nucleotide 2'-phosphodiesterase (5'-nucleotidase family)
MLCACSFKKSLLENQTQSGHSELYSEPEALKKDENKDFKRLIIAATNDVHGHYQPHQISFKDRLNENLQSVSVGGVDVISSYFKILRQNYGQILMLDSGDIFSEKAEEMNFVSDFYSTLEYDAIIPGLKDFNLKLPTKYRSSSDFLKDFSAKSKTPLILSNLYELKSSRIVEWPGTLPYLIREVDGVKVGILGLIADDIVEQTPVDNRIGLYVENMLQSTLSQARLLRSLGAEVVVVLTHQGLNCGEEIAQELKLPLSKVNFQTDNSKACDLSSKMGEYLSRLPPGLVDVVIGGRNHQKTANVINSTIVMNGYEDGKSFSYAELFINKKTNKLQREKSVVHQPVVFCREFFKETNDCYTEDSSVDHKARVQAQFLGKKIVSDSDVEQKFHYYLNQQSQVGPRTPKTIQSLVDFFEADISFASSASGDAKLVLLNLKGTELLNILEDDYNQGLARHWMPSPFKLGQQGLALTIKGSSIEAEREYQILVDITEAQNHSRLKKFISQAKTKSLNNSSWNHPEMEKDNVSTQMAASETVR